MVRPEAKSKGTGGMLLQSLLDEAEDHGVGCVCLFTRIPDFFFKHGFRVVEDRTALPDKIYKDCQNCPRLYRCDEVAMARGQIPKVSILGTRIEAEQLVRPHGIKNNSRQGTVLAAHTSFFYGNYPTSPRQHPLSL